MLFLQPAVAREDARIIALAGRHQRRAAHRHHGLAHQPDVAGLRQVRAVLAHVQEGQVDVLGLPGRILAGVQEYLHIDVRMQLDEAADARRQPQRGQRGVDRQVQAMTPLAAHGHADVAAGGLQQGQSLLYGYKQSSAGLGHLGPPQGTAPVQQRGAQVRFQRPQLMTDRAFGDVQLDRGATQAAEPGDGLEGA